jgi:hypothetical protein
MKRCLLHTSEDYYLGVRFNETFGKENYQASKCLNGWLVVHSLGSLLGEYLDAQAAPDYLAAMQNLKQHWNVLKQETGRSKSRWVWGFFSALAGVGLITIWLFVSSYLAYLFHETRSARTISALLFALSFMVWLAHCWRTYHSRIIKGAAEEWLNRVDHIRRIGAYEFAGHKLREKGTDPGYRINRDFITEVDDWRKGAESAAHQLSEAHKDAFYKNSICQQGTPDENQFARWIPERLAVLSRTLDELKALPKELRPYSGSEKLLNAPDMSGQS